jgi:hypothetical protein
MSTIVAAKQLTHWCVRYQNVARTFVGNLRRSRCTPWFVSARLGPRTHKSMR